MTHAYTVKVRGVVQGVGFRPFVYRLAHANSLTGWVLNAEEGVEIHLEGEEQAVRVFLEELKGEPPPAASIENVQVEAAESAGHTEFKILPSTRDGKPTARVSPDLPVCQECLAELFDSRDRRFLYPYINCTRCGPRYTVVRALPYDRAKTTMAAWPLDDFCSEEYEEPDNRRFHAQPVACPECGPHYYYRDLSGLPDQTVRGDVAAVKAAAQSLADGAIVAVKGLGGYHLACDAQNAEAVAALRTRKYRKEKPFALMAADLEVARRAARLSPEAEELMKSAARPIVLTPARIGFAGVAPGNEELGVMLPYTPLHYLLFEAGAPEILVMTSANRSSEPIAYEDDEALRQLSGIADGFLIGERPIARRVDDSVARAGTFGPAILRRGRGYAPGAVATIPTRRPILAVGADLKNAVTLVVDGQAFASQHIGDLQHYEAYRAFESTIRDLLAMYQMNTEDLMVVHDAHPQYASSQFASQLNAEEKRAVQHHRAHIASVIAERGAWEENVVGVSFDGTGYGDDRSIWGGEFFAGSVREGFERVGHLREAALAGGDAAAAHPVQAAAGFLAQLKELPDLSAAPFSFPERYRHAAELIRKKTRTFATTSVGRLFDTVAALVGFTRETSFEGQAAMWLEQLARKSAVVEAYALPWTGRELDFRPLLQAAISDRLCGRAAQEIARAFQRGFAIGVRDAAVQLCSAHGTEIMVLSGGVFQNEMLLSDLKILLEGNGLRVWTNHAVPANDGGISLGQAALAAFSVPEVYGTVGTDSSVERAA